MSVKKIIQNSIQQNRNAKNVISDILVQLLQKENEAQFHNALATLPKQCKEVLKLYLYHKQSRKAIAGQLKISLSSVHNRLHRGVWLLKTQFAKKPKNPV